MTAAEIPTGRCQYGYDHHWVSAHEPGHIIYWVRQCSLCHAVDWGDLDKEIRQALRWPRLALRRRRKPDEVPVL